MSPERIAHAPGKLFLLGEYAVLDGGLAVVVAIEPGLRVCARRTPARHEVRVHIPRARVSFAADPQRLPRNVRGALAFVLACFGRLPLEERRDALPGLEVTVEFPDYTDTDRKVGLGGSAALVAAVTAVLFELVHGHDASQRQRPEVFARAAAAHCEVQGGRGSGADVAACIFGGVVVYRRRGDSPSIAKLPWPPHLGLAACWTGQEASTPDLVQLYGHASQKRAPLHQCFLAASEAATEEFVAALRSGTEVECVWQRAAKVLPAFASQLGIPYLTPALEQVLAVAEHHGVVAKPSGAGGGDVAVALCAPAMTTKLAHTWRAAGFWPLPLRPASEGVVCA